MVDHDTLSALAVTPENILSVVPPFEDNEVIISKRQTTKNIITEVIEAHKAFVPDYDLLIDGIAFKKTEPLEVQLFDFCKNNLHYNVEPEAWQTTRSPAGVIELGMDRGIGVDCKHYAGYIAGVLDAYNRKVGARVYDWCYRFASYDGNPEPGHVFVVVYYPHGHEIWIDPVLNKFDKRKPEPTSYKDKTVNTMPLARLSGTDERERSPYRIGETGAQVAKTLNQVAQVVQNVPVVGYIGGYVLEAAALVAGIFGSKYAQSTGVRWLCQSYEKLVLNENVNSDNKVNANDCAPAQLWFSTVLGVPVYDVYTWHNLAGTSASTNKPLNNTYAARVAAYKAQFIPANPNFIAGVSDAQIMQAVIIAATMDYAGPQGSWAGRVAAPILSPNAVIITNPDGTASVRDTGPSVNNNGQIIRPVNPVIAWVRANPLGTVAIIGGAVALVAIIHHAVKK